MDASICHCWYLKIYFWFGFQNSAIINNLNIQKYNYRYNLNELKKVEWYRCKKKQILLSEKTPEMIWLCHSVNSKFKPSETKQWISKNTHSCSYLPPPKFTEERMTPHLNHVFVLLYQKVCDIVLLHEWLRPTTSRLPKAFRCEHPSLAQRIHYWQYQMLSYLLPLTFDPLSIFYSIENHW